MTDFNERRFGKFHVGREVLEDNLGQYIYQGMIPLRVEHDYAVNGFDVTACSEHFEPVERGFQPPFYDWEIEWMDVTRRDITGFPIGGNREFRSIRWTKRES